MLQKARLRAPAWQVRRSDHVARWQDALSSLRDDLREINREYQQKHEERMQGRAARREVTEAVGAERRVLEFVIVGTVRTVPFHENKLFGRAVVRCERN